MKTLKHGKHGGSGGQCALPLRVKIDLRHLPDQDSVESVNLGRSERHATAHGSLAPESRSLLLREHLTSGY